MPPFETFSTSLAKADKPKNGDACDYTVLLDNGKIVAMALADGVGSKPCDYLASATAVQAFLTHFADNNTQTNIKTRMQAACVHANHQVHRSPADCTGMLTTFVAVVLNTAHNELYYTSVGDSRVYRQHQGKLIQLSQDDSIDKTETVGGQTHLKSYITRALGAGEVHFDIQKQPFLPGDACWLSSDGFYNAVHAIGQELPQLWKYLDFEKGANQLFKQYIPHYQDDATVVALRRNDAPPDFTPGFAAWQAQNFEMPLPAILQVTSLTRTIFEVVVQCIRNQAIEETLSWFVLLDRLAIVPDIPLVEGLLQVFGEVKLQSQDVYKAIRTLLAKAAR